MSAYVARDAALRGDPLFGGATVAQVTADLGPASWAVGPTRSPVLCYTGPSGESTFLWFAAERLVGHWHTGGTFQQTFRWKPTYATAPLNPPEFAPAQHDGETWVRDWTLSFGTPTPPMLPTAASADVHFERLQTAPHVVIVRARSTLDPGSSEVLAATFRLFRQIHEREPIVAINGRDPSRWMFFRGVG